jgi:putative flippase GtrA
MTVLIRNPRERTRFLRFAVVGVIGAVVDFGIANLLVKSVHAPLVVAGTVSFICAILSNFFWNRYWTYPDSRSKPLTRQMAQFFFINTLGLAIRVPILKFLEPMFEHYAALMGLQWLPYLDSKTVGDNMTLALAVVIVMFWNFFANRYWTYSDVD